MSISPLPLSKIYADPSRHEQRYEKLTKRFSELFPGSKPTIVRSPGRVNLIGEHIDYSHFSVMPMAIEDDVIMAFSVGGDSIEITNMEDDKFPAEKYAIPDSTQVLTIDQTKTVWTNYFKCGHTVGRKYLLDAGKEVKPVGMKILVHGTVPDACGLSSSAAFVVCSTLVTLLAQGMNEVSRELLTQLSITCEQLIGVNTGGMDQAASIYGQLNHTLLVDFAPTLKATPFQFPATTPKTVFLVANTLVKSNKHETAPRNYNLRVVEITLAVNVLLKNLKGVSIPQNGNLNKGTLHGIMKAVDTDLYGLLNLVETLLPKEPVSLEEVAKLLDISTQDVKDQYFIFPVEFDTLALYSRAKHVVTEAIRVLEFQKLLSKGESDPQELGKLMNQSQQSCNELFNCSCPAIEKVCEIVLKSGGFGSRLTGAGWGGSTVHLVEEEKLTNVIDALKKEYYSEMDNVDYDSAMVVTVPGQGCALVDL
ncbi:Galactokinase [Yarrowia sp. C11]|nr:Galactokinase [Yarrowia sp. E02]KAG5371637.1 Galactokinase [Yarrowia sp. C11]